MSEKRPKNGRKCPECALFVSNTAKTKNGPFLGLRGSKTNSRAPIPPATSRFLWFPSLRIAQRDPYTLVPVVTSCNRRAAQPAHSGGHQRSAGVPGAKKMIFFKVVPRPVGMLKQVFLARFEPVVARFRRLKTPKCLENGPFWDQKTVKNGSKTHFSKGDPGPFGKLKQVFVA